MRIRIPTLGVLLAAAVLPASAQVPTYYVVSPAGINMRLAALGEASCAEALDVSAMFGNPASLNHLRETGLVLTHQHDPSSGGEREQMTFAVMSGAPFALAVNGTYQYGAEIRPQGVAPSRFSEYGGDIAAAMSISPVLSVGAMGGIRRTDLISLPTTSQWAQAGLFYYPTPGIAYGIAYRVRNGYTYWFSNNQSGVQHDAKLGQIVEIGTTMTWPSRSDRPMVTLSLTTEKFFPGISLFSTKGGLEVLPVQFLALRMGFKVGSFERVARYGLGFLFDPLRLDAAIGPGRTDNRFAGVSLSVRL